MRRRFLVYGLIGLAFGIFDWHYLQWLSGIEWGSLGESMLVIPIIVAMNFGIWLVPVLPAAVNEARRSGKIWSAALAAGVTWVAALVSYYAYYAVLLALGVLPQMEFMGIFGNDDPYLRQNWLSTFQGLILGQFIEWLPVGVIGGAVTGGITGTLYLVLTKWSRKVNAKEAA